MTERGVLTARADQFRGITAQYSGNAGCGHFMFKGDEIGYDPVEKRTRCQTCWRAIKQRLAKSRDEAAKTKMKLV